MDFLNRPIYSQSGWARVPEGERRVDHQGKMIGRLRAHAACFRREVAVFQKVVRDPRCPRMARLCLGGAIAYTLSPIDIIPDFIPVVGHLDDLLIVPLLIWLGIRAIPRDLLQEIREQISQRETRQVSVEGGR